jgi:diaminopimelate decarboxylase
VTPPFHYVDDALHCEGVSLSTLAAEVGTPTYVYSKTAIVDAYRAYDAALAGVDHQICYSVKANSTLAVLAVLAQLGAGADIVSVGELYRWQRAGGDPGKVVFSGVGKTDGEIKTALAAGIQAFNVESIEELVAIDRIARTAGVIAPVSLRVNPDVDAQTHPYISTGLKQNKFGIPAAQARDVFRRAAGMPNLLVRGIDCHIGSQLTRTAPFSDAIDRLCTLVHGLLKDGLSIDLIDVGGGLGIDYGKDGEPPTPSPGEYGKAVRAALKSLGVLPFTLLVEPGRSLVGPAGTLLTRVLYRKSGEGKHFTIVDTAMNDLLRPAFYDSHHPMQPVTDAPRRHDPGDRRGRPDLRDQRLPRSRSLAAGAAARRPPGDRRRRRLRLHDGVELQLAAPRRRGHGRGHALARDPRARDPRAPRRGRADVLTREGS